MRRLIDVFSSGILLLLAAPLLLITALAIWLTDRGCVLYRQTRVGLRGRPFELLKFRSMRINTLPLDDVSEIREGHALVTPVGRWLRRFKVDELPQLLNVLRGDMALVGPRPTIQEQVDQYSAFERRRLSVRPGMTGWAQVNGGIEITWPERIMLDVWYADHRSLWLDAMILWQTAAVVLFGDRRNPKALQEAAAYSDRQRRAAELDLAPVAAGLRNADSQSHDGPRHPARRTVGAVNVRVAEGGKKTPGKRRVVHLTSVHPSWDIRIFHKECKSLAMAGYDVTLIAPRAQGDVTQDGVRICAVRPPRSRFERMTRTVREVYQAAVRENADIYHFHDPELMPVGFLLSMRGKRVIYDVHEDYAANVRKKLWIPRLLRMPASVIIRACEVTFTMAFHRVIAVTPTIARKYQPAKTRLVQNFPWTRDFRCSDGAAYEKRERMAVYIGALSDNRGLREMIRAVKLAAEEIPLRLVIAGWVNPGVKVEFERESESGLVEHKGLLKHSEVAELLSRAKVGLVLFHPDENYVNAQPNKMFEYMAAGLPVVASDFPLWRKMIRSAECGLLADPLNPAAIAEALVWLLRHPAEAAAMGRNGRRAVAEKYNWERESECLIATYAELQPA